MKKTVKGHHKRHRPNTQITLVTERESLFLVKGSTPFVSALKRVLKMLDKFNKASSRKYQQGPYKSVKYITIKGMGKSIETTLGLANKLQNEFNYKVDVLTGSVEVLDEFETKNDTTFQKRMVSSVEVRVWRR